MIRIVGLGPGGMNAMSAQALEALRTTERILIRTEHHPAVAGLSGRGISFESLDRLYESAGDFEELYGRIVDEVLAAAASGDVVYAVPGHPLIGERSVEILLQRAERLGLEVKIEPSPSFIDAVLETLRVSVDDGIKLLDAMRIETLAPSLDTPNLIYQVYDKAAASRVKLRLMEFLPDEREVYVVRAAGTPEAQVLKVPLFKLDWRDFDHLTSVYVPGGVES